jgi:hypothetical protein
VTDGPAEFGDWVVIDTANSPPDWHEEFTAGKEYQVGHNGIGPQLAVCGDNFTTPQWYIGPGYRFKFVLSRRRTHTRKPFAKRP